MFRKVRSFDYFFIVGLGAFLVVLAIVDWTHYLFKLPFVTLLVFYSIGKWARGWEMRRKGETGAFQEEV